MPWVATMSTFRDIIEKTEQYAVDIINGRQETVWDRLSRYFCFCCPDCTECDSVALDAV